MITKKCKHCGKEFNVYPSEIKKKSYCSKICRRIIKHCLQCNQEFKVNPARKDTAKFCSHNCSTGYYSKIRMQDSQFKSKVIAAAHTPKANKTRAEARRKVCSKVIKNCVICNKEFKVFPSTVNKYSCCSRECGFKYNSNMARAGRRTSIEVKMAKELKQLGIQYEEQKAIGTLTIADFFIKPNLVIYTDGDYWHSLPKAVHRDKYVNIGLEKQGYNVLRFWEHDIHNNIGLIRKKITEATV